MYDNRDSVFVCLFVGGVESGCVLFVWRVTGRVVHPRDIKKKSFHPGDCLGPDTTLRVTVLGVQNDVHRHCGPWGRSSGHVFLV